MADKSKKMKELTRGPLPRGASKRVRLSREGRVVIPADCRKGLGLERGNVLFVRLEDGEIVLLTAVAAMRRVQAMVRQFVPDGVSLVDELIEERRREAQPKHESDQSRQ